MRLNTPKWMLVWAAALVGPLCCGCGVSAIVGGVIASVNGGSSSRVLPATASVPQATIDGVSPATGSHFSDASITLTGSNLFEEGLVVLIGDTQATVDRFVSSSELRVKLPPLAVSGPVTVRVTSARAKPAALVNAFTVTNTPPALTVDPIPSGQVGTVAVRVLLSDADSNPAGLPSSNDTTDLCDLVLESKVGAGSFVPVAGSAVVGGNGALETLETSSSPGVPHVLVLDTLQIVGAVNSTLQLRITPVDRFDAPNLSLAIRSGSPVLSNTFTVTNNNPPQLALLSAPARDDNTISLAFEVDDPDVGSAVTLSAVRYTNLQTGLTASASAALGSATAVGGVLTELVPVTFKWDSLQDLGFGNGFLVLLEIEVSDGVSTVTKQFSPPFFVDNGPFESTQTLNTTRQSGHADLGDASGDGGVDLALSMSNASELQIWENDNAGGFVKKVAAFSTPVGQADRVMCGPLAVIPIDDGGVFTPYILCVDIADISSGTTATSRDGVGNYPEPSWTAPGFSAGALTASFPNSRAKALAAADMNGDGRQDLVVLLRDGNRRVDGLGNDPGIGSGQLVLFAQTGAKSFSSGQNLLAAPAAFGVRQSGGDPVTVDRQAGDFNLVDVDGDDLLDVILAETATNLVRVYTQGAVPMINTANVSVSMPGQSLICADSGDIDGDGKRDIVALTNNGVDASTILVYRGNGDGTFDPVAANTLTISRRLDDLRTLNVTRSVTKDDRDDVIVGDTTTTNVGLFVADSSTPSGFLERAGSPVEVSFPVGSPVAGITLGDIDKDGRVDVAAAAPFSNVPLLRVATPRMYFDAVHIAIQDSATTLAAGNFLSSDGSDDLAVVNSATQDLQVLQADSVLVLATSRFSPFRASLRIVAIDSDGDGQLDDLLHLVPNSGGRVVGVAIIPQDSSDLVTTRPSTGGTFIDPETVLLSDPRVAQIVAATPTSAKAVVLTGGAVFISFHQEVAEGDDTGFGASFSAGLALGDVGRGDDGAGGALTPAALSDIVLSPAVATGPADEQGLFVIYGAGANSWSRAIRILGPTASPGRSGALGNSVGGFVAVQVTDMNGDGNSSILAIPLEDSNPPDATGASQNSLVILDHEASDIGLTAYFDFDPGNEGSGLPLVSVGLATADFDADTFPDVAIASNLGPTCNILFNRGVAGLRNGGLSVTYVAPPLELSSDPRPVSVVADDLLGDATRDDLVMTTLGVGALMVYTSNGDGTFNRERNLLAPEPFWCATGDFNGDGLADVVSSARGSGTLAVFLHK